jgi:hypothetical protein
MHLEPIAWAERPSCLPCSQVVVLVVCCRRGGYSLRAGEWAPVCSCCRV